MPFDLIPFKSPVEQRQIMGRIALEAMARYLDSYEGEFNTQSWATCGYGVTQHIPELVATGLAPAGKALVPTYEGHVGSFAVGAALGINPYLFIQWSAFSSATKGTAKDYAASIRLYLSTGKIRHASGHLDDRYAHA